MTTRVRIIHPDGDIQVIDLAFSQLCTLLGDEFRKLPREERWAVDEGKKSWTKSDGTNVKIVGEV